MQLMHDSRRGNSHFQSKTEVVKVHIIIKISIKGNNSGKRKLNPKTEVGCDKQG